ncbi:MAG: Undecaprenyl pyrophosphate synthetase [Bryobacterales bacterium]|nr:Undecaprenyl pyrophosphate synthetase [Bryobacterales bacterium]
MKELLQSLTPGDRDWRLASELDPARIPAHIAIIMDGNGRWAKRRNLPRILGHKAGMDTVSRIVETCAQLGLEALTLYAFSVDNWKRPRHEVEGLWRLLRYYLRREMPRLMQNGIQLVAIGRLDSLPPEVRRELLAGMEKTSENRRMRLNLAINYGGRTEIVDAVNCLVDEARLKGELSSLRITEEMVSSRLYTAPVGDPDLLIRTSGEMRISNFLLWQIAYSELYVTDTLWPDFSRAELLEAVLDYQNRERRFGGLSVDALPSVDSASFSLEEEALELPLA